MTENYRTAILDEIEQSHAGIRVASISIQNLIIVRMQTVAFTWGPTGKSVMSCHCPHCLYPPPSGTITGEFGAHNLRYHRVVRAWSLSFLPVDLVIFKDVLIQPGVCRLSFHFLCQIGKRHVKGSPHAIKRNENFDFWRMLYTITLGCLSFMSH